MMKTIYISYSELRAYSEKVMDLIRNFSGIEHLSLSSKIEAELGIAGDDADELLHALFVGNFH